VGITMTVGAYSPETFTAITVSGALGRSGSLLFKALDKASRVPAPYGDKHRRANRTQEELVDLSATIRLAGQVRSHSVDDHARSGGWVRDSLIDSTRSDGQHCGKQSSFQDDYRFRRNRNELQPQAVRGSDQLYRHHAAAGWINARDVIDSLIRDFPTKSPFRIRSITSPVPSRRQRRHRGCRRRSPLYQLRGTMSPHCPKTSRLRQY
jgi:hypothetical protein